MSTLERAIAIATKAHDGQVDKGGSPYVLHPLRIMPQLSTDEERIVAVLHDVVEDGGVSLEMLRSEGFSRTIVDAIDSVTRRTEEAYEDFVLRAGANQIGRQVKMADLFDNCDLSRIKNPTPADYERLKKYQRAIKLLRDRYDPPSSDTARESQLPEGCRIELETEFVCALCGKQAGRIALVRSAKGVGVLRHSFTSIMGTGQPSLNPDEYSTLRAAMVDRNARSIWAVDFELTPFFCPVCNTSYCGDHWTRWDEFDDGFHDCIRGRCPNGHVRMLED